MRIMETQGGLPIAGNEQQGYEIDAIASLEAVAFTERIIDPMFASFAVAKGIHIRKIFEQRGTSHPDYSLLVIPDDNLEIRFSCEKPLNPAYVKVRQAALDAGHCISHYTNLTGSTGIQDQPAHYHNFSA